METIRVFNSVDEHYDLAFKTFIENTDQKRKSLEWLEAFLSDYPSKIYAVDAGAGNGVLTKILVDNFTRVDAIEPNNYLHEELRNVGPNLRIFDSEIIDAPIEPSSADLVFCSHVFYYINLDDWDLTLRTMLSWLKSNGKLVVVLQYEDTDCMRFSKTLRGQEFPMSSFIDRFCLENGYPKAESFRQRSNVFCKNYADLLIVLEFLANLTPFGDSERIPGRDELLDFANSINGNGDKGYLLSSDQVFYTLRK